MRLLSDVRVRLQWFTVVVQRTNDPERKIDKTARSNIQNETSAVAFVQRRTIIKTSSIEHLSVSYMQNMRPMPILPMTQRGDTEHINAEYRGYCTSSAVW